MRRQVSNAGREKKSTFQLQTACLRARLGKWSRAIKDLPSREPVGSGWISDCFSRPRRRRDPRRSQSLLRRFFTLAVQIRFLFSIRVHLCLSVANSVLTFLGSGAFPKTSHARQLRYVQCCWYYTYMAKLTLSLDDRVVSRAKQYAKRRGVSVSEMVEAYLSAVAEPPDRAPGATPVLDSVRGILKNARIDAYRKHLTAKYR